MLHVRAIPTYVDKTKNMLKAYLSTQPSSVSAFMISKTHIVAQIPCKRQLNAKPCGIESAIFVILSFFVTTQSLHSFKFTLVNKTALPAIVRCIGCHFLIVRMRTRSIVPRPKTTLVGLRVRLVHTGNCMLTSIGQ